MRLAAAALLVALAACAGRNAPPAEPRATVHQVATAPGVSIEVFDWGGSGRPLVFLHGGGAHTARVFEDFAPRFAGEHRVVGITRRGGGASSDVPAESLDELVDDVAAVLDTLRLGRAVLVGHSFAGVEMARFGERHPERCAGLVYLDAAYDYTDPALVRVVQSSPPPQAPPMLAADSVSVAAVQAYVERTSRIRMPASEILASRAFDAGGRMSDFRVSETRQRIGALVRAPRWEAVGCPSLAIYALLGPPETSIPYYAQLGEAERAAAAAYVEAYGGWTATQRTAFGRVPGNSVVEFPGGNHYFFLEKPSEAHRLIADFVAGLP